MRDQRFDLLGVDTLLTGWSKVIRVFYRLYRKDGRLQAQDRDLLDRGDGVTVLLYNREQRSVLLLRQPRIVARMRNGEPGETIEACNGLVEGEEPLACALREVEQETGHRLSELSFVGRVYASPGASLEIVHLFTGSYSDTTKVSSSGGLYEEGEDIEVLEVPIDIAMEWVRTGLVCDARTILVLQHAVLTNLL